MKDVSVVVPVWREFERLGECLDALQSQTARDRMEIVVSIDGRAALPSGLARMADRLVTGEHGGPAAARNRGWRESRGRFILFTDSDCVPEPPWAEELVRVLESGADGVKGAYSFGGGRIIQRLAQVEFQERYRKLATGGKVDLVDTYSAGFRREALEAAGGFDVSFPLPDHEDVDLSYRMAAMGMDLRFDPHARVAHRHRDTWTGYFRMKFGRGRWRVKVLRSFPGKAGSDSYTPRCMKLQILLCPMLPAAAGLLPVTALPAAVWGAVFLLSSMPLCMSALRHDPVLLPLVPLFAFWRGCALSSGLVKGIFGSYEEER